MLLILNLFVLARLAVYESNIDMNYMNKEENEELIKRYLLEMMEDPKFQRTVLFHFCQQQPAFLEYCHYVFEAHHMYMGGE
jgi:hypothetical protein